jgi:hypothetical protein
MAAGYVDPNQAPSADADPESAPWSNSCLTSPPLRPVIYAPRKPAVFWGYPAVLWKSIAPMGRGQPIGRLAASSSTPSMISKPGLIAAPGRQPRKFVANGSIRRDGFCPMRPYVREPSVDPRSSDPGAHCRLHPDASPAAPSRCERRKLLGDSSLPQLSFLLRARQCGANSPLTPLTMRLPARFLRDFGKMVVPPTI